MNIELMLKYGDIVVQKAIDGLPHSDWLIGGVCGVWNVKDVIGHLGVSELTMIEVLQGFLGGGETPLMQQFGELGNIGFNDHHAALRKDTPIQEILDEYNNAVAKMKELAEKIPPETWSKTGTLPWYGDGYALDDLFMYSGYAHKREHSAQINVFRDNLKK